MLFISSALFAQNRSYNVFIDNDTDENTGCVVAQTDFSTQFIGIDAYLSVETSTGPLQISSALYYRCLNGSFDSGTPVVNAALGLNTNGFGEDVVEAQVSIADMGFTEVGQFRLNFSAESVQSSDIVTTNSNTGGLIFVGTPIPVIIPFLSLFSLLVLILIVLVVTKKVIIKRSLIAFIAISYVSVVVSTTVINFIIDGNTGDWTSVNAMNDPIGDNSAAVDFTDITQVFAHLDQQYLTVRLDVLDIENASPMVADTNATVLEDGSVLITLTGTDADNDPLTFSAATVPNNGTLSAITPIDANSASLIYTPNADFFGADSFTYIANDGQEDSLAGTVNNAVTAVNDQPSFSASATVDVFQDTGVYSQVWANSIVAGPANESSQILTFIIVSNDNPALFSAQPSVDGTTGFLTFTPADAALGVANVIVQLQDDGGVSNGGVDLSTTFNLTINVLDVNEAPSFVKGADETVLEDAGAQVVNNWATAISAGPANESGQVLTFNIVSNDNTALFSAGPAIDAAGNLTYTPAADANGVANVVINLQDDGGTANGGVDTSPDQSFVISVTAVNDAPSFTSGGNVTVDEDSGAYSNAWATALSAGPANESSQTLSFNMVSVSNGSLFSSSPALDSSGNLTFTPAAGQFGTATVSVNIMDNGLTANGGVDTSSNISFDIIVREVNDVPSFVKGADETVLEDAGAQVVNNWATAISAGPANEGGQVLTFNLVSNDNTALFSAGPAIDAAGNLTYTPAADANGVANVVINLQDDGGTANGGVDTSPNQSFVISVTAVNDVPSFSSGGNVTVDEDSGAYSNAWATALSAGPADESSQTLSFNMVSVSNGSLFSSSPALDSSGNLTFTPAAGQFGTSTVTVNIMDNGLTANGGVDTSSNISFDIIVQEVNDAPVLTAIGAQSVDELTQLSFTALATDANVPAQTLTFSLSGAPAGAVITNGGQFTWTPTEAQGTTGTFMFDVIVTDDGSNPANLTDSETITVTVNKVNTAPVLTAIGAQSVDELVNLSFNAMATDADDPAQILSYSLSGSVPTGASISPAGSFSWTPTESQGGTLYTFNVVVTDNGSNPATLTDLESISVTVNEVNTAPVLAAIGNQTIDELTLLSFMASATDSDLPAQTLSYSLSGTVPTGASITSAGAFTWTPSEAQGPGNYSFNVVVTDNGTGTLMDMETISVNVNEVNVAPVANSQMVTTDDATPLTITLSASDADGNNLTFSIASAPATGSLGAISQLTATTASVTYTPGTVGDNSFTFIANDGSLNSVAATVTLNVTASNQAPTANNDNYSVTGNVGLNVPSAAGVVANDTDPDLDTLTVTASDANSVQGGTVSVNSNGSFTYIPPVGYVGADSFAYTLSDGTVTDGATVNLTVADKIWFIDNSQVAAGNGSLDSPFNTLAGFEAINGSGGSTQPAAGECIFIDETGNGAYTGPLTLENNQTVVGKGSSTGIATECGISLASNSMTLPSINGARPLVSSASTAIALASGNTLRGFNIGNSTVKLLANNFATLTINQMALSGTGKALDLTTGTAAITLDSLTSTSSASEGVDLSNVAGTLTVSGAVNITNSTTQGLSLVNSSANVSMASSGSITAVGGNSIVASSYSGTFTFAGTITHNIATPAVRIISSPSATTTLSGAITASTANATAIDLNNHGTVNLTGGMALTTTAGSAFQAVSGGVVNVTGLNTATSTTGTAVNISGSIIGGSNVTFRSVSATGSINGIVLSNTGAGGFVITGDGTAVNNNSGGTIQSTTGQGISLTNVAAITLNQMRISATGNDGIFGSNVTNFVLNNSDIINSGNAINENGIDINGLFGVSQINNSSVTRSAEFNVKIENTTATNAAPGTADSLTITSSDFGDNEFSATGADGIFYGALATANMSLVVSDITCVDCRTDGIQVDAGNSSSMQFSLTTSTFTSNNIGLNLSGSGTATSKVNVFSNTSFTAHESTIINIAHGVGNGSFDGFVMNNPVIDGSVMGNGVTIIMEGSGANGPSGRSLIGNNVITDFNNPFGIQATARAGSASHHITIEDNTVQQINPASFADDAVRVTSGNGTAGETNTVCLDLENLADTGGADNNASSPFGDGYEVQQRAGTTFQLEGLANSDCSGSTCLGTVDTQVEEHIADNNTGTVNVRTSGRIVNYTNSAGCTEPTL